MKLENDVAHYPSAPVDHWEPSFPDGRIERLYLHWSAQSYRAVFPAYHFCIAMNEAGTILVVQTNRIEANMRDLRKSPDEPYAAHTRGRNSFAVGLSIMAMEAATPHDFGEYPLTEGLIDGLCLVAARLAKFYGIPIDGEHVLTHAEAAVADGYFGTAPEQRWDIARVEASAAELLPAEAAKAGSRLRKRITHF